ncbi:MAG: hypothetical protein LBC91_04740 [Candidatus Accumulibacter sp.]|jgi:hypothetical protein|nr:hypothetical protein [Accumulibacter sp.]
MRRDDIRKALEAARAISNHHEFVVAGSLSVLGLIDTPPEAMSMSIDIDFFPLRDPGRAGDIASVLGEDSDFHLRHGYYLDAISPDLPVLPNGWCDRLIPVQLGLTTAFFLEVHDTAVSKYARGNPNDYRWLEAGYEARILMLDVVESRVRFGTTYFDDNDRRKTGNGLLMHKIATQPDGSLSRGVLEYLHAHPPTSRLRDVDPDHGEYSGPILWVDDQYAIQSLGRGDLCVHNVRDCEELPIVSGRAIVRYCDGKPSIITNSPERECGSPPFPM